ncbi:hypothetical protein GOP47_0004824 [Adiantum capillus-veneris]|uniref:Uncharacterized protein n=1 Tax=Adiantum capillus-veneris TaxID=13818 RepID=A0A9D4ZNK3_ADICA|nr:hypothetical protein GOP47_0004824 [Adiantum capillus-veneris]
MDLNEWSDDNKVVPPSILSIESLLDDAMPTIKEMAREIRPIAPQTRSPQENSTIMRLILQPRQGGLQIRKLPLSNHPLASGASNSIKAILAFSTTSISFHNVAIIVSVSYNCSTSTNQASLSSGPTPKQ